MDSLIIKLFSYTYLRWGYYKGINLFMHICKEEFKIDFPACAFVREALIKSELLDRDGIKVNTQLIVNITKEEINALIETMIGEIIDECLTKDISAINDIKSYSSYEKRLIITNEQIIHNAIRKGYTFEMKGGEISIGKKQIVVLERLLFNTNDITYSEVKSISAKLKRSEKEVVISLANRGYKFLLTKSDFNIDIDVKNVEEAINEKITILATEKCGLSKDELLEFLNDKNSMNSKDTMDKYIDYKVWLWNRLKEKAKLNNFNIHRINDLKTFDEANLVFNIMVVANHYIHNEFI